MARTASSGYATATERWLSVAARRPPPRPRCWPGRHASCLRGRTCGPPARVTGGPPCPPRHPAYGGCLHARLALRLAAPAKFRTRPNPDHSPVCRFGRVRNHAKPSIWIPRSPPGSNPVPCWIEKRTPRPHPVLTPCTKIHSIPVHRRPRLLLPASIPRGRAPNPGLSPIPPRGQGRTEPPGNHETI